MIELALFGAGRIGQVHGLNAALHANVRLKYIVDPVASDARDALAFRAGAAIVEAEDVFRDGNAAGVIIASSTDTHADFVLRAAATGKAIFCEKPVSLDFGTVERVVAAVDEAGVPCLMGFQRRHDPDFRTVRDRIASGAAGRLEHVVMHTRDPSPPPLSYVKRSGGMFRDQAVHDFDMARYLLGEEIASVFAAGACLIDPKIGAADDIDTAMITLTSHSGRFVQMVNCRRAPFGYDQRLEALCANEVLYVNNHPARAVTIADARGFRCSSPESYFIERFSEAYRAEMENFVSMIETGAPPLASIADGLEAQRLAEAALVSMTRKQPVNLTTDWRPH